MEYIVLLLRKLCLKICGFVGEKSRISELIWRVFFKIQGIEIFVQFMF